MMTPDFPGIRRLATRATLALSVLWLAACDPMAVTGTNGPRINTAKPVNVALLVPAGSGQANDEILATGLENAARLAMADLQGARIDLRVYRTGGNAATAAATATQAVNEGAKIILGPVFAASSNAAGLAVANRGINVLSFSNNTDIAGHNVFVLGSTFENTANRLVRYAVSQGRGKIMIVYGKDTAEEKGRDAIAAAIARNGASNVGEVSFELTQVGLINAVSGIASTVRSSGAQAVFLTSGTAGALPILSQLLIDNGIDSTTTQLVGLQRWDIPATARDLPGLQGGWFALPSPELTARFNDRYTKAYGQPPHPIAGLAYDGIAAIGALTSAALTQPTGFAGVNGIFRLLPDGTNERGLAIAELRDRQVNVIDPAPRSFGGAGF